MGVTLEGVLDAAILVLLLINVYLEGMVHGYKEARVRTPEVIPEAPRKASPLALPECV